MPEIIFIDIEVNPSNHQISDIGAVCDSKASFHANSLSNLVQFLGKTEYIGGKTPEVAYSNCCEPTSLIIFPKLESLFVALPLPVWI